MNPSLLPSLGAGVGDVLCGRSEVGVRMIPVELRGASVGINSIPVDDRGGVGAVGATGTPVDLATSSSHLHKPAND